MLHILYASITSLSTQHTCLVFCTINPLTIYPSLDTPCKCIKRKWYWQLEYYKVWIIFRAIEIICSLQGGFHWSKQWHAEVHLAVTTLVKLGYNVFGGVQAHEIRFKSPIKIMNIIVNVVLTWTPHFMYESGNYFCCTYIDLSMS